MYLIDTKIATSSLDGKGVFTKVSVKKGTRVWVFDPSYDLALSKIEYGNLDADEKHRFGHSAYLSLWSGRWICPPRGDAAEYTNHSANHNLNAKFDESFSTEPFFVANRDINAGEELTNNYHQFDEMTRTTQPVWARSA
jgi:SET domain-containing protein